MIQHQLHDEHTLQNNLARHLVGENAQLRMQLEKESAKLSAFESLLREQLMVCSNFACNSLSRTKRILEQP